MGGVDRLSFMATTLILFTASSFVVARKLTVTVITIQENKVKITREILDQSTEVVMLKTQHNYSNKKQEMFMTRGQM